MPRDPAPADLPAGVVEVRAVILRWRRDPCAFVREVFQVEPQGWQAAELAQLKPGVRIAIRSGHGVGKTTLLAWVILWGLVCWGAKVPCTASTRSQLRDALWSEIALWHRRMIEPLRSEIEWQAERVVLKGAPNEAFAVARTAVANRPEALQGFHGESLIFILEEASGIPEAVYQVAEGALSGHGAMVIAAGNPTRTSGFFYDAFHSRRNDWRCVRVSCADSPRVSPEYIKRMARFGVDSSIYRVRVLGEFPRSADDTLIPLEWIERAVNAEVEPIEGYRPIWGLDVARFGDDSTCLAKRAANHLLEPVIEWRGLDTMQVVGRVKREWEQAPEALRPHAIMVDAIGIGAGVADRLREIGLPARDVVVSQAARLGVCYRLRDELWWAGRAWFEAGTACIPDDASLIGELSTPTFSIGSDGLIRAESKDQLKKRGLPSPNRADALLLTFDHTPVRSTPAKPLVRRAATHVMEF